MKKIIKLLRCPNFVLNWLIVSGATVLAETFMLGLWALPIVNYRISYMSAISVFDLIFVALSSLLFGLVLSLYKLGKRSRLLSCSLTGTSGILSFLSLLCPVCPIFFLSFFGLTATLILISPYFLFFRVLAVLLLVIGSWFLAKNIKISNYFQKRKANHSFIEIFQQVLFVLIAFFILKNQSLAINLGERILDPAGDNFELSGNINQDVRNIVVPSKTPFYGQELGLDFSNIYTINKSIYMMGRMAPMQGDKEIKLNEAEMQRYIKIGTEPYITCEFCCGVKTLVSQSGEPTCGCAHSIAMRGMVAYLIRNHPELSDAQISFEVVRQKGLYFPNQMQKRFIEALSFGEQNQSAITADIKYLMANLTNKELRDLRSALATSNLAPTGKSPDMVGGC